MHRDFARRRKCLIPPYLRYSVLPFTVWQVKMNNYHRKDEERISKCSNL